MLSTGMRRLITTLPPPQNGRRAYLVGELAAELNVAPSTVYRWVRSGLLKGQKKVGYTVIPVGEVRRFIGQESLP